MVNANQTEDDEKHANQTKEKHAARVVLVRENWAPSRRELASRRRVVEKSEVVAIH